MGTAPLPPQWNTGFALSQLGYRLRQVFKTALTPQGLRPVHYGILVGLAATGSVSQRELAGATGIDRGDLVRVLDTLEHKGLAKRVRDPGDRRRYLVGLTVEGDRLVRELRTVAEHVNDHFLAPLDETERTQLEALLVKLWRATMGAPIAVQSAAAGAEPNSGVAPDCAAHPGQRSPTRPGT